MTSGFKAINSQHVVRFWRSHEHLWFQTILTLFWNFSSWSSILLFQESKFIMNGKAITSLSQAMSEHPSVSMIFALPLIGSWLIYHSLALWINRTELFWDDQRIIFKQGPLPWVNTDIRLDWSDIEKVWFQEYSPGHQDGRALQCFKFVVHLKSQGILVLMEKLSMADKVVLEKWLEESTLLEEKPHQEAA
jgi:hypothetical protein